MNKSRHFGSHILFTPRLCQSKKAYKTKSEHYKENELMNSHVIIKDYVLLFEHLDGLIIQIFKLLINHICKILSYMQVAI